MVMVDMGVAPLSHQEAMAARASSPVFSTGSFRVTSRHSASGDRPARST